MEDDYRDEMISMEEGKNKSKLLIILGVATAVLIVAAVLLIRMAITSPKEILVASNPSGEASVYSIRILSNKQFLLELEKIAANGHKLTEIPNIVYYKIGDDVLSRQIENAEDYTSFIREVWYNEDMDLLRVSIPKYIIYK